MIAYKGFNKELCSVMGDGNKQTCHFEPGETKKVEKSKTARNGFHCCENPFECLEYYAMNEKKPLRQHCRSRRKKTAGGQRCSRWTGY